MDDRISNPTVPMLGRVDRVVLTKDDWVEVQDALGYRLRMPTNSARQ